MSVLMIVTYDVTDPQTFAKYNPGSVQVIAATIAKHAGQILVSEPRSEYISGEPRGVTVVIRFPTADAAKAWHEDPEYLEVRALRLSSTDRVTAFIANEME